MVDEGKALALEAKDEKSNLLKIQVIQGLRNTHTTDLFPRLPHPWSTIIKHFHMILTFLLTRN